MRDLNRRDFLRLCGATGAALGLSHMIKPEITEAFSGPGNGKPLVIWLQGGSCSGCSISLLNSVDPDIAKVLSEIISLRFHQTLMAGSGETALNVLAEIEKNYAGQYYLVVEGSVSEEPYAYFSTLGERNNKPIPLVEWVRRLGANAKATIAVGTCAAFGGIPAAGDNPSGARPVSAIIKQKVINVPGCPTHPDQILGTIVHAIKYGIPELDRLNRPKVFYGECVHDVCYRREAFDKGHFAKQLSDRGCLYKLGCKGPMAYNKCATLKYNNGVNWCIGANSPCLACSEPGFPDKSAPFFEKMEEYGPAGTPAPKAPKGNIIGGGK